MIPSKPSPLTTSWTATAVKRMPNTTSETIRLLGLSRFATVSMLAKSRKSSAPRVGQGSSTTNSISAASSGTASPISRTRRVDAGGRGSIRRSCGSFKRSLPSASSKMICGRPSKHVRDRFGRVIASPMRGPPVFGSAGALSTCSAALFIAESAVAITPRSAATISPARLHAAAVPAQTDKASAVDCWKE